MVKVSFPLVFVVVSAVALVAQPAGFTRTVLQQVEISAPGREAITARAEFAAVGASVGRHTHFGEEIGYVAEGAVSVEIDGTTKMVRAGEAFIIPNGKPHDATNAGPGKAVLVITYVVEKGKPLATPVR
jgi:quercetin dioxygenase-like cupin family protein